MDGGRERECEKVREGGEQREKLINEFSRKSGGIMTE